MSQQVGWDGTNKAKQAASILNFRIWRHPALLLVVWPVRWLREPSKWRLLPESTCYSSKTRWTESHWMSLERPIFTWHRSIVYGMALSRWTTLDWLQSIYRMKDRTHLSVSLRSLPWETFGMEPSKSMPIPVIMDMFLSLTSRRPDSYNLTSPRALHAY